MIHNEPQCFVALGHREGIHAPGLKLTRKNQLRVVHHVLLAHGKGVRAIRSESKKPASIGLVSVGLGGVPHTDSPEDIEAARRYTFRDGEDVLRSNIWWFDPLFTAAYPQQLWEQAGDDVPDIQTGDMDCIAESTDFIGLNYYQSTRIRASTDGWEIVPGVPGAAVNRTHWFIEPSGIRWIPRFFHERYRKPIFIMENGISIADWVGMDGVVSDAQRIEFTRQHLIQLQRAIQDGVDVLGYHHWSLMDNFEWATGYRERFGLVHVDFESLKRTPKQSYHWYAKVIETNGTHLSTPLS